MTDGHRSTLLDPSSEDEFLKDICRLLDEGVLSDRSEKLLRPIATVVGSARNKDRDEDASQFVRELRDKYPFARLVVSNKSPVEKSAAMTALSMGMPCEVVKPDDWTRDLETSKRATLLDEVIVGKASHVVAFDDSDRSQGYKRLASRTEKPFSTV